MKEVLWGLELETEGCPRTEKSDNATWFGNGGRNYDGFHGELKVIVILNNLKQMRRVHIGQEGAEISPLMVGFGKTTAEVAKFFVKMVL